MNCGDHSYNYSSGPLKTRPFKYRSSLSPVNDYVRVGSQIPTEFIFFPYLGDDLEKAEDLPAIPVEPKSGDLPANPVDLVMKRTFLEDMMEAFLTEHEMKESALLQKRKQNEIEPFEFEILVNLIKSQLGR